MRSTILNFRIEDDKELIPLAVIKSFTIYSSVHSTYPLGELILDDNEGRLLSELAIRPGSVLLVEAVDEDENTTMGAVTGATGPAPSASYFFCPMVIVGLENTDEKTQEEMMLDDGGGRTSTLGGQVKVHLAHPWSVFSNWANNAWEGGTPISAIIDEIVKNSDRGFSFANYNIGATDDGAGGPSRYKLQESESEFIVRKLLPYASIDKAPIYSFVDERNSFIFQNFANLYNETPEFSIVPPSQEAIKEEGLLAGAIKVHEIVEGYWYLGRNFKDQLKILKKKLYVEDSDTQVSFRAGSNYKSPIPGYTLLKKGLISGIDATSSDIVPFRAFSDGVRLSVNRNSVMNEFFEIGLTTSLCMEVGSVGKTVDLRLLSTQGMGDGEQTPHWANGKWLITASEHFMKEGQTFSKLLLARPAINLPDELNPDDYYKLEM